MAVLHADLVGPLPEGWNSRNQRGFQYILSVMDSAKCYLWLLPLRHKTAEAAAVAPFDEVIPRVSVPSAISADQGGEFMTRNYPPSDLGLPSPNGCKCEQMHFSVHNVITKLMGDKHQRWPDLLGTVALAYNAMVHSMTGYSPHEPYYSFAPACPLDTMVTALVLYRGKGP